jgi:hypothetical protein
MPYYIVERRDISWIRVEADSPEEAREVANDSPDYWEFLTGDDEVIEDN